MDAANPIPYVWIGDETYCIRVSIKWPQKIDENFHLHLYNLVCNIQQGMIITKTYCIINCKSGRHTAAGRVDVKVNWLCGVFSFEE